MLSLLFASTAEAAAPGSGFAAFQKEFGLQWHYIVWQIGSFTVLALTLYFFAIKPVLAAMGERNARLAAGLQKADEVEVRLNQAKQESAELLKKASLEAQGIVNEARAAARDFTSRTQMDAQEQAQALLEKARATIEAEHKKMMADARTEVTRLVVATAEKVLRQQMTDVDRSRYNAAAAKELAGV